MSLIEDMFRRFVARQSNFLNRLTPEERQKLADLENKYAELRVSGKEGCVLYFQYKGQHLYLLDGPPQIPSNKLDKVFIDGDLENYSGGDEVIIDVIDGSLSPRAAIGRKYFWAKTDKSIYDIEEFAQAFEKFLTEMRLVVGAGNAS